MPETYTRENFNPSVIPAPFKPETRKTIELAVAVGWSFLVTDRGHATIIAPNDVKRFHMNAKNAEAGPVQSVRRQVLTHGKPELVAALEDNENAERDKRMAEVRKAEAEAMAKAEADGARKRAEMGLSDAQPASEPDPQPTTSKAAEQRFPCPEEGCPKVFVSSHALRGHKAAHKPDVPVKPTPEPKPVQQATPEDQSAVEKITNGTKVTAADGTVRYHCAKCDADYGTEIGLHSHQKKHNGTSRGFPEKGAFTDLNASEIVKQIRDLVSVGVINQADYDAVVAERDALQEKYDALVQDHQSLRDNLAAFKDLLP